MASVIALAYEDRTLEQRVANTLNEVMRLGQVEIAEYIVQLEMRLEELGDRDHYTDNVAAQEPS